MPPANKSTDKSSAINVKLLLIGNSSVGKSSLLLRFSDEQWLPEDEASATIGVDFRVHKMDVNGKKVKLSIWVRLIGYASPANNVLKACMYCGRIRLAKNAFGPSRPPTIAAHRE